MVENYQDLFELVKEAGELYQQNNSGKELEITQAENGSCSWFDKTSGKKFVFMLAKLGDELKLGYAYYEPSEKQPDWIDDTLASLMTKERLCQLVRDEFLY